MENWILKKMSYKKRELENARALKKSNCENLEEE